MTTSTRITSLWLLIPLIGFPQIGETIFTPSLPHMSQVFGASAAWVNATLSLYFLGFALGVLFFGTLCDRIGRRPSMLLGLFVYIVASAFCILSPHISMLLLSRLLQGFGASVGSVVTQTMMRDLFVGANRSKVFSIVTAALALSPAIGPFIGGIVDEYFGFRGNLTVLFLMGVLLFFASFLTLRESRDSPGPSTSANVWSVFCEMVRSPFIWRAVLLIAGCNGILFSFYGEAPFLFQTLLGFSPSSYGKIGLAIGFSSMLGAALSHRLATTMKPERIVEIGSSLTLFGALMLWSLEALELFSPASPMLSAFFVLAAMFFILLGFGLIIPNTVATALKNFQGRLGQAGACFGLLYYLIIGVLTEGMGVVHNGSISAMAHYFVVISTIMLGTCVLPLLNHGKRAIS